MSYFPGIADEEFIRGNIPMTKQEVRVLALNKAKIGVNDIVLDIGAGTGSFSIEAALLASAGKVYAIERESEGTVLIAKNAAKFKLNNLEVITGAAPAALAGLPKVDVIFIGGSGGHLAEIIEQSEKLLKSNGRIIITAVTIETLYNALKIMQSKAEFNVEACGVQVTRIKQLKSSNMLQALNPIYIIAGTKKG